MPIYEYQCLPNQHRFEVRHGMNETPVQECPECGAPVRRVIHPVGIVFKGSGFYATDSRSSSGTSPSAKGSTETKTDTPSTQSTSEGASAKTESTTNAPAD